MLQIQDTIVSLDLFQEQFLCDITKCNGICCVEGDGGAPVDQDELEKIEKLLPELRSELSDKANAVIDEQGISYKDQEGDLVLSIVDNRECVFTYKEDGIWKCAIEKAFYEGKTDFKKPISCHLYPIRLKKYPKFTALSYNRWDICKCACELGRQKSLPIYEFLKEPLIRKFGEQWYLELEITANEFFKSDYYKKMQK